MPDVTVYAADVTTGTVKTLGGEDLFLIQASSNQGVQIWHNGNLVNVVKADVEAKNVERHSRCLSLPQRVYGQQDDKSAVIAWKVQVTVRI